jgi:RecB family exonuclease
MKIQSVSSIGTFEKCPKHYQYRYILKPDVVKKKWDFSEFGSCAHRALELFHKHLMTNVASPSDYGPLMTECFDTAVKEFDQAVLEPHMDELYDVIKNYLKKIKNDGLPEVIAVEKEFHISVSGYEVRGFIDRIDRVSDTEIHVVDYKTSKDPSYLKNFQLLVYAIAIKNAYPKVNKIYGSYCLLKHKSKMMTWEFSDNMIEETKEKIKAVSYDISVETKWKKKPSKLCDFCDYKDICQGGDNIWI